MLRYWTMGLASCLILMTVGCGQKDETNVAEIDESELAAPIDAKPEPAEKAAPQTAAAPVRDTLAGRWLLMVTQQGNDFIVGLLDVQADEGGGLTLAKFEGASALPGAKVEKSVMKDGNVQLVLDVTGDRLDFQGALRDGAVWGNYIFGAGRCEAARLVPTDQETLGGQQAAQPAPGREAMQQAFSQDDTVGGLKSFLREFKTSPLALDAAFQLVGMAASQKLDTDTVQTRLDDLLQVAGLWGDRMVQAARVNAGMALAGFRYDPEFTLKTIEAAEQHLTDPSLEGFPEKLADARKAAKTFQALEQLEDGTDQEQQQAAQSLKDLGVTQNFDHLAMYALGEYAEETGNLDEALDHFGQLAALPLMEMTLQQQWLQMQAPEKPLPTERVAKLWKEKHGSTEGLDEFLDSTYDAKLLSFADQKRAENPGNRTVLCELFTGAQCPPCVAADVATGGVEATYPRSDVIVLRYHMHIPGPDPLANEDTEDRFHNYYEGEGTPTIFLNGRQVPNVGGLMPHAVGLYEKLQNAIDPLLAEETSVKIDASAQAEGGRINVKAQVNGLESVDRKMRLRLALVEDELHFQARNGIRKHEMIVRWMVGGASGIAPRNGALSHAETVDLAEVRDRLSEYLKEFEEGQGIEFRDKPMDLERMHLVVFLQDDDTKQVLQATAVPVSGDLSLPEQPAEPNDDAAQPATPEEKPTADEKPATDEASAKDKPATDDKPATNDVPAEENPKSTQAPAEKTPAAEDQPATEGAK